MYYDTYLFMRHSECLEVFEWDRGWYSIEATNLDSKYSKTSLTGRHLTSSSDRQSKAKG